LNRKNSLRYDRGKKMPSAVKEFEAKGRAAKAASRICGSMLAF
jgi:hypothetical protein